MHRTLLTDTLISGQLELQQPSENPVFLSSQTNFEFLHSCKQPQLWKPFSLSPGCLLTTASNVVIKHVPWVFWTALKRSLEYSILIELLINVLLFVLTEKCHIKAPKSQGLVRYSYAAMHCATEAHTVRVCFYLLLQCSYVNEWTVH